jgi:hypothetical protein
MNRNIIITFFLLTTITAPMMAMDESDPKITALLQQPVRALGDDKPIDDEALLGANPSWQTARNWNLEDKNKLLRGAMSLRQFQETDTRIPLAVAIGADPNYDAYDENEISKHPWTTALTRASRYSNCWLVQYLLEKKADPNQTTRPSSESCPLECATTTKIVELLLAKGAIIPKNILLTLYTDTPEELVGFYLELEIRPEQNELGETPLHIITPFCTRWMKDRFGKAQMLIKAGVDLCARTKDKGNTALHYTAIGSGWALDMPLDISDQIGSAIIDGCKKRYQGYQERFTLLCCLNRVYKPLYGQRPLCRARFGWKPRDKTSPFQLLSIQNNDGKIPFQLWPENEELNPANHAPVQGIEKK